MKKLILLAGLAFSLSGYSQAEFEKIQITENTVNPTAPFVSVQETNGLLNKINKTDLQDAFYFATASALPVTGITDKLYITRDDNKLYRFNGTIYVLMSADVSGKENTANKQNSLAVDGTGVKFPTVDAVINSTVNFNPKTTKIAFIGDSITYGVGSTSGETSYADILNSFFGFQTYTKLGFSSMTVKPSSPRPQLSDKIALIPAGTNFITLMIGINDWAENNVIGDVNVVNAKTYASLNQNLSFAEAFRYNLETIKRNFPNAQIRVITPIKHDDTWNRDLDFKFYVEAEMQIANFLSIPIINAYDGSEIYQSSTSTYIPDGIHPNDAGYNMIAEFVKKGIIDKKTEHQSNTQYNSLVVGKQELRSNTSGETLRLTGKGFNGGDDSVGGVSLGLFFNGSGNRYSYLGGSDSQKKLIFYDNSINVYDFTNGVYSNLDLGSFGKRVNVGNSLGSGDIMNISNYTYPASNVLLGLFGGVGQFGDYIKIEDVSSNTLLRFKASGDLEISGKAIVSTAPTNANDVVRKTELDLKANLASPALTGTPTAPTATAGTNTTQIATTAFVLANAQSIPHLEFNNTDKTVWNNGKGDIASNTSFGDGALRSNTTGSNNTANGVNVLRSNTTGSFNTANGANALSTNTIGINNTANGVNALNTNTTGSNNTANGGRALRSNTTGTGNTANGVDALGANTTGTGNTANGVDALGANTTGSFNTANGTSAGSLIADGTTPNATSSSSVFLGDNTRSLADNQTNQIVIGSQTTGAGSNTATLGNTSITKTVLRGTVEAPKLNLSTTAGSQSVGNANMVAGTVTITTTSATTNSVIMLTRNSVSITGFLTYTTANGSFTINSNVIGDAGVISYVIFN